MYDLTGVKEIIKDRIFSRYEVDEIVYGDGSFILNDNMDGDTVWSASTYSNGELRVIAISAHNILPSGRKVNAMVEAFAYEFDDDIYDMIDYLDSEEAEMILTKRFERNFNAAAEAEKEK